MTEKPFDTCPVCGGEIRRKKVEKVIMGGNDTAVIELEVDVCLMCGERLYTKEDIQRFEDIKRKLIEHDISSLQLIGRSYQSA